MKLLDGFKWFLNPVWIMDTFLTLWGGGGGQQTSTGTTYTSNIPEYAKPYVERMLGKAEALSSAPYQQYGGERISGFSPLQQQGFQSLANLGVAQQLGVGTQLAGQAGLGSLMAGRNYQDMATNPGAVQSYMSPYIQGALNPQLEEARRQSTITNLGNRTALARAGAYGGGRGALMESEGQRNLATLLAKLTGEGYKSAYDEAQKQFNIEQGLGLQAAGQGQQFGLATLQKQADLGAMERAIEQEGITADIGQFKEERDFPYKQVQYLQSLLQGLPLATQSYSYAQPSMLASAAGGTAGLMEIYNRLFGGGTGASTPAAGGTAPAPGGTAPATGGVIDPFLRWDLYSSPSLAGTQLVDMKLGVSDLESVEFFKAIITMFNLVIVQDEPNKTIRIEPYNTYYDETLRVERDWTEKLDLKTSYKIEPLSFELSKELQFTYTKGSEEYLNKLWEDSYNFNYGRMKYVSNSNLLTGVQEYEIPFAALPTSGLTGAPNFIIPMVYRELITENAVSQSPYASKPHIFFWTGNRYAYTDSTKQQQNDWWLLSGGTAVRQTTYPCVSHLSSLDIYDNNYVSDLNFSFSTDFFFFDNPFPVQATPYTLYNSFWRDYIENTYSNETKRLTGKFYLEPIEVYQTKLTDKIFVKDSFYRIEKLNDANLIEPQFTDVSLIKERGGYYQVIPPAPYYFLTPNQPYPGPPSPTGVPSYTGSTQGPVCSGTSGTGLVYQTGTPPFSDGDNIFSFDGTVYTPMPQGTFVRWTGSVDTYVVINNVGQIIQIDC